MDVNLNLLVSVAGSLVGVLIGGWITLSGQAKERRAARIRRQLDDFYGPLLAMRESIVSLNALDQHVSAISSELWPQYFENVQDPVRAGQILDRKSPSYDASLDYSNNHFKTKILPTYDRMAEHFREHMSLAEPSTRAHYAALVQFVELWNRWLEKGVPADVVATMQERRIAQENQLAPFYHDLEYQFRTLSEGLKKL